jgi:hypothetical protein
MATALARDLRSRRGWWHDRLTDELVTSRRRDEYVKHVFGPAELGELLDGAGLASATMDDVAGVTLTTPVVAGSGDTLTVTFAVSAGGSGSAVLKLTDNTTSPGPQVHRVALRWDEVG